jgi:hypothetical protein
MSNLFDEISRADSQNFNHSIFRALLNCQHSKYAISLKNMALTILNSRGSFQRREFRNGVSKEIKESWIRNLKGEECYFHVLDSGSNGN